MTLRSARTSTMVLTAIAITAAATSAAQADLINIFADTPNSTENLGNFTGSIDYTPGIAFGALIITLSNTSAPANDGFITGFVFNIDSVDAAASATLINGTHPFTNTGPTSGSPFGNFDAGAALGGDFLGAGSPNAGIAVGATGIFTFLVSASDTLALTAASFINGPNEFDFIVRFRGFADEGSDKVPATVPAPSALALLLLSGCVSRRRRS
jgi:hypothetical protein